MARARGRASCDDALLHRAAVTELTASAVLSLTDLSARTLLPTELCDRYIVLGGGTSQPVVQGLWNSFGERTATLIGAGANALAAVWNAMATVAGAALPGAQAFTEAELAAIYQDPEFVPSRTLDAIGPLLSAPDAPAPGPATVRKPAAARGKTRFSPAR